MSDSCRVCNGKQRVFDPKVGSYVVCPACCNFRAKSDSPNRYYKSMAPGYTELTYFGRYAGFGMPEDAYGDESNPGYEVGGSYGELYDNICLTQGLPKEGDTTIGRIYRKTDDGQEVLVREETFEWYFPILKSGKKSKNGKWKLIDTKSYLP